MITISEGDALKAIDDAISAIDDDAKIRVLQWANLKFMRTPILGQATESNNKISADKPASQNEGKQKNKSEKTKSKATKKTKLVIKQIKDLNLRPNGKASAHDFVTEKNPTTQKQKCVVALYWLLEILELEQAGLDHIYTFFKGVNWPSPTNFPNTLHQAGSSGWLDTADAMDYKITPMGENVVKHDLPKKDVK